LLAILGETPASYLSVDLKRCSRCGQAKPLDEFPWKVKSRGLRRVWCRDCCRAYGREHYRAHTPYYLDKTKKRRVIERPLVRERVYEYLREHPCVDCGQTNILMLDFDHRDPALKRVTVSRLIRSASWPSVAAEIAKCDVRCANCHRRRTAQQFAWTRVIGVTVDPGDVRPGAANRYARIVDPHQDRLFSDEPHGLRRCSRCQQLKPLVDFPFHNVMTGARGHYCRPCKAAHRRDHYRRNKHDYIRRAENEMRLKKQDALLFLHEYLRGHPCVDCGETDIETLDLDHVDPARKTMEVSKMIGRQRLSTIQAEIDKCVVRCANCHRMRTAMQQSWVKRFGEEPARYARIAIARE